MDLICEGCEHIGKPPWFCIWACPKEKKENRMIDFSKVYYLAHPCTTGGKTIEQNRVDEKVAYYQLQSRYPGIKVIRPLDILPDKIGHKEAMEKCFSLLDACDAVIFAGSWLVSKGCMQEFDYCKENGKGIIELCNIVKEAAV